MQYEILAPAGGEQTAYAALVSGANAIYLGVSEFSARAGAENFDLSALARIIRYAHLLRAQVYVALNTLVKDGELESFLRTAVSVWNAGADAIILQDIYLGKALKRAYPQMNLHLSTQAGCCNVYGAQIAKQFGFSRVVLARETPLDEIKKISQIIQTEVFVQGALCSSFSGQCYLSSFAGNNSGNRGRCKQPCRKKYKIDRNGYEGEKYALSLSDLSVGERVEELLKAGVYSLKIEGRMRRVEYVTSAVAYYRALLRGEDALSAHTQLKRAYNRGDYTAGLAFGQDSRFLSRNVQGHIGERVGEVSFRKGKPFCESYHPAQSGDCFKILRGGEEVGGAQVAQSANGGFFLATNARLRIGDEVRITTDTASNLAALEYRVLRPVSLDISIVAGEKPTVRCGDFTYTGENPVDFAKNAPLSCEQISSCFAKTDGLPFAVEFTAIRTQNAFLAKSQLNALRREFYAQFTAWLLPEREQLEYCPINAHIVRKKGNCTAAITTKTDGLSADILIYKPNDYATLSYPTGGEGEKYLYLPAFFTSRDEQLIADKIPLFDGIYSDGFYALALAEKYGKPLFAGTGFNLTNAISVSGVSGEACVRYFALSKELTDGEQRALCAEGAFALTAGSIKVMDLIYCPFERTCSQCDRRALYTLTDEGGREFPLRRYRADGVGCRFEVYNCASLAAYNGESSALVDLSAEGGGQALINGAFSPEESKKVCRHVTGGHANRSLL